MTNIGFWEQQYRRQSRNIFNKNIGFMDFSFPRRFIPHTQWTFRSLDVSFPTFRTFHKVSLPLYTVSDAKFKSQIYTSVKYFMGSRPRPGKVTMPLRPCSRRGDGSLPHRQVLLPRTGPHHTQIVFHGADYEYCYLSAYLCYQGIALACLPLNHI